MANNHDRQLIIALEREEGIVVTATNLAHKNHLAPTFSSEILFLDRAASFDTAMPSTDANKLQRDADPRAARHAVGAFGQLHAAIARLTENSRLYITGHGDETHQVVGGWRARELAELLCAAGLRRIRTVSLVACGAAGNAAVRWDEEAGAGTFASQLATIFAMSGQVETTLYARCYRVGSHAVPWHVPDPENPHEQIPLNKRFAFVKRTRATENDLRVHKRPGSKIRYVISNGKWVAEYVDYPIAHGMDSVFSERRF